jgi:hypothetical protein
MADGDAKDILYTATGQHDEVIRDLCTRYSEWLPDAGNAKILVLDVFGVAPKSKGSPKFGEIELVKEPFRTLLESKGMDIDYVVELYDDHIMGHTEDLEVRKRLVSLVLLHLLYTIDYDEKKGVWKTRSYDVMDFKWLLDKFGDFIRTGHAPVDPLA